MEKSQKNEPPIGTDDAFAFFTEIGILHQLSRALLENELPNGLQVIHFSVLNNLTKRGEGRLPSDLAKTFQVPRSNMTDILAKLEKLDLIIFRANPKDGRSKLIYITEAGQAFRQDVIKMARGPMDMLATRFDMKILMKMLPSLVALREVMDEMRSK